VGGIVCVCSGWGGLMLDGWVSEWKGEMVGRRESGRVGGRVGG
jgi:hypothetical protein